MAWNEPGGGGDKKDPWGSRGGDQGPPDLDEVFKKLNEKIGGLFGGGRRRGGGTPSSGKAQMGIGVIVVLALIVWGLSGIYIIDEAERGVELRFGKYKTTTGPGPHWHIPFPIEKMTRVNVDNVRNSAHKSQMLTKDENLIIIELSVQYRVKSAEDFIFKVRSPDYTLKEAAESALREVVGSKKLDEIISLGGGREVLVVETHKSVQEILDKYETGLLVEKVNLESTQPPQEVQSAFEDAIKAREDEDRYKKQAEAYERDIIPKAEGDAQRLQEEAEGYKRQVVAKAKGESSRFLQTLKEYNRAPVITRKRLYLEAMEEVLSNASKVMVKIKQGNNIMYLPLDRIMSGGTKIPDASRIQDVIQNNINTRPQLGARDRRDISRERRAR